jgi:hypothetical protein
VFKGSTSKLVEACSVTLLIAALIAAWPGAARAEDRVTEEARQHYEEATKHYDLGHWDEAIAEYEKAYELRPDPSFLYNLAQVNRRKGDARKALDLYKNYLRKDPKSPKREEVEEKIAALQKQIDESAAKIGAAPIEPVPAAPAAPVGVATPGHEPAGQPEPAAPPPAPLPPVPSSASAATVAAPSPAGSALAPVTAKASTAPSPGRGLRIAGIVCGSVGAGSIIAGAVFGLRARSLSNKVAGANKFNPSDQSAGQRAETLQWTFYGIGAGAIVAGGVLYYLGLRAAQPTSAAVSLGPMVGPGTAGLSAMGVF